MEQELTNQLSQSGLSSAEVAGVIMFVSMFLWVLFFVVVVAIVTQWRIFSKAGQEGWKSLIPVYNTYILLKIVGRPGVWLLLLLIPVVNIVIYFLMSIDLAKAFGKSAGFGIIGLWFFSLIGYLILAFGDAQYVGPVAAGGSLPEVSPEPVAPATVSESPAETQPEA